MLKKTGKLANDWTYKIVQIKRDIKITFIKKDKKFIVEEYMEMVGFGIDDYSVGYLQYLLNKELGINIKNTNYKPTVYH